MVLALMLLTDARRPTRTRDDGPLVPLGEDRDQWLRLHPGLQPPATLGGDERMAKHHRLAAVRPHLLEMAGNAREAREWFSLTAKRTTSRPEQRCLEQ